MAILSGNELVTLAMREPARDLGEFAGRLVDYIADESMLHAVQTSADDSSVAVAPMFARTFDILFRSALEGLDRCNPTGAMYLRAGITTFLDSQAVEN
ncbi:hypothetical protein LT337_32370 (plasmid) [Mycolicibacterium fortuitum]|nr:hypothetical protein LT337_32370 [Mycolicibacterium fortuitum]